MQGLDLAGSGVDQSEVVESGFEGAHLLLGNGEIALQHRHPVEMGAHGRYVGPQRSRVRLHRPYVGLHVRKLCP